jgi:hypothetical protein
MLAGARILLLEDDFFTALELVDEIEASGACVVGPYATVAVALRVLETEHVDGAILDLNLADRDVTPVARLLLQRDVPVVINSGALVLPLALQSLGERLPIVHKPSHPSLAMAALASRIH